MVHQELQPIPKMAENMYQIVINQDDSFDHMFEETANGWKMLRCR